MLLLIVEWIGPDQVPKRLLFKVNAYSNYCVLGQPFPDSSKSQYTWPAEMKLSTDLNLLVDSKEDTHEEVDAMRVDSIWEPIECLLHGGKTSISSSSSRSKQTISSPPCYIKCFQGF